MQLDKTTHKATFLAKCARILAQGKNTKKLQRDFSIKKHHRNAMDFAGVPTEGGKRKKNVCPPLPPVLSPLSRNGLRPKWPQWPLSRPLKPVLSRRTAAPVVRVQTVPVPATPDASPGCEPQAFGFSDFSCSSWSFHWVSYAMEEEQQTLLKRHKLDEACHMLTSQIM